MATTVSIAQVSSVLMANAKSAFTVTINNTGSSSVSLTALSVSPGNPGATTSIEQPQFLTPQVPIGLGNPTIAAGSSVSFGFSVVFNAPRTSGPPANIGGLGNAGMMVGQPALVTRDLIARAMTSDGESGSFILSVPVLSAAKPFPTPEGGMAQFTQGANANLIAVIA